MVTNTSSTPAPLHPPCGNARRTAWRAWWHWTVMVALGEVVGFGIPVLIGASAYALRLPESILHTAVIVGGMGEGIVLGLAQWLVLRQYVPRLSARAWVLATGAGALLAWVIGMGVANVGPTVWQRSPPLFITVAGVLTVVFLLSMGGHSGSCYAATSGMLAGGSLPVRWRGRWAWPSPSSAWRLCLMVPPLPRWPLSVC